MMGQDAGPGSFAQPSLDTEVPTPQLSGEKLILLPPYL